MGCVLASDRELLNNIPMQWLQLFYALRLADEDVVRLHRVFFSFKESIGSEHEDPLRRTINISDLSLYLNITHTVFNEKAFGILDSTQSGKVDFRQFVLLSWNLSTLSYDNMCQFVHDLYHSKGDQFMSLPEITLMIQDLHEKQVEISPNLKDILSEVRRMDEKQHIDFATFKTFCSTYTLVLFPAILLQERLRATLFWGRSEAKLISSRAILARNYHGNMLKGLFKKDDSDYWSDVKANEQGTNSPKSPKDGRSRSGKAAPGRESSGRGSPVNTDSSKKKGKSVSKKVLRIARNTFFGKKGAHLTSSAGDNTTEGSPGGVPVQSDSSDVAVEMPSKGAKKKKGGSTLKTRLQQIRQSIVRVDKRRIEFDNIDADHSGATTNDAVDDPVDDSSLIKKVSRWRQSFQTKRRPDLYSTGIDQMKTRSNDTTGKVYPTA